MSIALRKTLVALFLLVAVATTSGCVRSRVRVTSEPAGATVTMNGVHLGRTPVEQPFTWYWYYDFVVAKEGYAPTGERVRFRAPVYLWPGLDLLMEMMPFFVTDTKKVHFVLKQNDERPAPVYSTGTKTQ